MAKRRYLFNEETLTFTEHKRSASAKFARAFGYLASSAAIAAIFIIITFTFFEAPKERRLKRENAELLLQYEIVNKQIDEVSDILSSIQERDDNIYRAIFESDAIPSTIRDAGFGGANRYEDLLSLDNAKLAIDTRIKLDVITKKLYVQTNSFDEIVDLIKNKEKMLMSTPSIMPVAANDLSRVASGYGMRIHPIDKVPKMHHGMDFSAASGTDIHATGNGIVEKAYKSSSYGNTVIIDHGYNYKTLYAHMLEYNVKAGQKVSRGQVIGYMGNTGRSRGVHLHYEVRYKGQTKNPNNFYFNDLNPEQYEEMIARSIEYGQSLD